MSSTRAFVAPFLVFMLFLALNQWVGSLGRGEFFLDKPQFWIFPLQTIVCGGLVAYGWRHYGMSFPRETALTVGVAVFVLVIWISPQAMFGFPPRLDGFDPTVFAPGSALYWTTLAFRFLRLVLVVPLVEEILWRGFLLRYLIHEDFETVPFGAFSWFSFGAVTFGFALEHQQPDWIPALITGALYNWVAVRTRSLSSCVLAHAVTNLLLGVYILKTGQWGFW